MSTYMKQTAPELLNKASALMEERGKQYDKPEGERSMAQTVAIFNLHHGLGMTEAQGWHFMQILKDVRLFQNPGYHQDSAEDCIAYAALKAEAKQMEARPNIDGVPAFLTRDVVIPEQKPHRIS